MVRSLGYAVLLAAGMAALASLGAVVFYGLLLVLSTPTSGTLPLFVATTCSLLALTVPGWFLVRWVVRATHPLIALAVTCALVLASVGLWLLSAGESGPAPSEKLAAAIGALLSISMLAAGVLTLVCGAILWLRKASAPGLMPNKRIEPTAQAPYHAEDA